MLSKQYRGTVRGLKLEESARIYYGREKNVTRLVCAPENNYFAVINHHVSMIKCLLFFVCNVFMLEYLNYM